MLESVRQETANHVTMSNLRSVPTAALTLPLNVVSLAPYETGHHAPRAPGEVTPQQLFAEYSQAWLYGRATQPFHWALRNPWFYLPYTVPPGVGGRSAVSCFHDTMRSVVGASQVSRVGALGYLGYCTVRLCCG
jgi:hypothetical protein